MTLAVFSAPIWGEKKAQAIHVTSEPTCSHAQYVKPCPDVQEAFSVAQAMRRCMYAMQQVWVATTVYV